MGNDESLEVPLHNACSGIQPCLLDHFKGKAYEDQGALPFVKVCSFVVLTWINEQLPFGGACASTRVAMEDVEGAFADTVPDWCGSGQCMAPSCGGRFGEGMTVMISLTSSTLKPILCLEKPKPSLRRQW